MAEHDTPLPTITAIKITVIKKGEYDIWSMRMHQYICHTDHNLWDVIINGDQEDEPVQTGVQASPLAPPPPKTAKQLAARRNQERVKSILLLAIPDEYLLKFHNKLISQLEVYGAVVAKEDINQKFLRNLPPAWNQIALIMKNKPYIDNLDINDLYNNLRVYEDEMKSSNSSTTSHNLAFLSSKNTKSIASGDFRKNNSGEINQVSSETACSFLAQPISNVQLENDNFKQLDRDDLEELDVRWQIAMLTDGLGGYDWSDDFGLEPANYALMAFSSSGSLSSSDNEVNNRSKQCTESFKSLKKNPDDERAKHSKAKLEIRGYELALESRILIGNLKAELEKVTKERDKLKSLTESWNASSRHLNLMANNQMSSRTKNGLGYGEEIRSNSETDSEISLSVFDTRSSDVENTPENDMLPKDGFHAVPPPITGEFLTHRLNISFTGLDELTIRNRIIQEKSKSVSEPVESNKEKVIIKDWTSDNEDEVSVESNVVPVRTEESQSNK
ncbi:hypothetical protein Tco_0895489 [Tanacetum coccineum]|uniref:Uncharacterized protein n=1 Tax=Tanacetum coccineum TaxID=301880 RepID=A0ABQ5CGA3_9ASTR